MKINHNGKRYDTTRCIRLGSITHYSHSNNISGYTCLELAIDNTYILATASNGQDCFLSDHAEIYNVEEARSWLDNADQDAEEEAAAIKCGLIELV